MADDRDSLIREQAYRLWQQAGEPHGHDRDHWEEAERTLGSEQPTPQAPSLKSSPSKSSSNSSPATSADDGAGSAAPAPVIGTDDPETATAATSAPAAKPAKKPATRRKRPG